MACRDERNQHIIIVGEKRGSGVPYDVASEIEGYELWFDGRIIIYMSLPIEFNFKFNSNSLLVPNSRIAGADFQFQPPREQQIAQEKFQYPQWQ